MSFLNSILLWGPLAAAGVAVPIVIHLLSRYRSRVVDWAAMELLRRVLVVRASRLRLKDLLLLLLRCLAVLLLALALARPVLKNAAWVGDSKVGVVIALDSSFSMGHNPGGQSRYDAARQRARNVIAMLGAADTVTMVQLADRPVVRLRNVAVHDERLEEFLARSAPLAESLNLDLCVKQLKRLIEEDVSSSKKECYLITDGQASTWENVSAGVREAFQDLGSSCEVFFLPVGSENAENVAVSRVALTSGVLRKGSTARYAVEVRNTGRATVSDIPVELLIDGRRAVGSGDRTAGARRGRRDAASGRIPQAGHFYRDCPARQGRSAAVGQHPLRRGRYPREGQGALRGNGTLDGCRTGREQFSLRGLGGPGRPERHRDFHRPVGNGRSRRHGNARVGGLRRCGPPQCARRDWPPIACIERLCPPGRWTVGVPRQPHRSRPDEQSDAHRRRFRIAPRAAHRSDRLRKCLQQ